MQLEYKWRKTSKSIKNLSNYEAGEIADFLFPVRGDLIKRTRAIRHFDPLSDLYNKRVERALVTLCTEKNLILMVEAGILTVGTSDWTFKMNNVFEGEFSNLNICRAMIAVMKYEFKNNE